MFENLYLTVLEPNLFFYILNPLQKSKRRLEKVIMHIHIRTHFFSQRIISKMLTLKRLNLETWANYMRADRRLSVRNPTESRGRNPFNIKL